jgi:hypothetical protein
MNALERYMAWRKSNLERARAIQQRSHAKHRAEHNEQQKRWRAEQPEKNLAACRKWNKANPEKRRAHWKTWKAIQSGKLVRSPFCQLCLAGGKVEAHHEDYALPLDVVWLCRMCHKGLSRKGGK